MTDPPDALTKGCERLGLEVSDTLDLAGVKSIIECLAADPGLAGLVEYAELAANDPASPRGEAARAALRRFTDGN